MLTVAQEIVIEQFANDLVFKIQEAIKSKPIPRTSVRYNNGERITTNFNATVNSTGNLLRSIRFELTDTHLIIWGADYAYYVIYGRKPTQNKGTGKVKDEILKWIRAKGVSSELKDETLAFLIARKIHREGSSIYIYNQMGSGIINNILSNKVLEDFNTKFTAQLITELKEEFAN